MCNMLHVCATYRVGICVHWLRYNFFCQSFSRLISDYFILFYLSWHSKIFSFFFLFSSLLFFLCFNSSASLLLFLQSTLFFFLWQLEWMTKAAVNSIVLFHVIRVSSTLITNWSLSRSFSKTSHHQLVKFSSIITNLLVIKRSHHQIENLSLIRSNHQLAFSLYKRIASPLCHQSSLTCQSSNNEPTFCHQFSPP